MSKDKKINPRPVIDNRQARFNFELTEDFEAGIALSGWEVKGIRSGSVDMKDSYVLMKDGEAWIIGLKITPTREVTFQVDPGRTRKLLLTKPELSKIFKATQEKGLTCIPTKLFWKTNLVKIKISLGKGKTKFDKRETLKRKEWDKEKSKISKLSSKLQ